MHRKVWGWWCYMRAPCAWLATPPCARFTWWHCCPACPCIPAQHGALSEIHKWCSYFPFFCIWWVHAKQYVFMSCTQVGWTRSWTQPAVRKRWCPPSVVPWLTACPLLKCASTLRTHLPRSSVAVGAILRSFCAWLEYWWKHGRYKAWTPTYSLQGGLRTPASTPCSSCSKTQVSTLMII